jgi:DNA-binding beta-propeller fold protein YncE
MKHPLRPFFYFLGSILSAVAGEDGHTIDDPLAAEAALLTSGFTAPALTISDPTGNGSWGPVIPWTPHIPVTAATLPDGRLLTFASNQRTTFPGGPEFTYSAVWDPKTGVFTEINNTRHDMFCGGTAMLPDGRVVINGGRATTVLSSIFDFRTNQWNALQNMNDPRWYNPSVAMPDGTVFTVSGSGGSNTAELWNSSTGWRRLTGVNWSAVTSQPGYINIWHPFLALAPNGRLFHFGPTDVMNWVNTSGSGSLTASGQNVPGTHYPKEGAWAMYDEGRILIAGGGATTTNNSSDSTTGVSTKVAYTVDLNPAVPVVAPANPMQFARQFANSVVLPSGEVLVIGGNTSGLKFNDTGSVLAAELWNPRTGNWRTLSSMSVPRNYHSVALLLPDGRVWAGGGGLGGNAADHRDAQIFTPPALFAANGSLATRPVIQAGPTQIGLGTQFTVQATPGLSKFSFIRMSAITHSVNTDLRYLTLPFVETTPGNYLITGHANSNVMLPGYWMLFGLDGNSVHSEAKIIQVSLNANLTINNPGDQQSVQGEPLSLPISISSLPSATIRYSATGLPGGLAIDPVTGVISGTITGSAGSYWTTIFATPNSGGVVNTGFNWTVLLPNLGNGRILREWWQGPTGAALTDLTNNAAYPANPTGRDFINQFECPVNWSDNYGQRVRGYVHPSVSGQYRFWIAGDDESWLLLGTNEFPESAMNIASVPSWSNSREWTKFSQQASGLITLEAGKKYYIEALMKEGGGGDNLAVGWQPPGASGIEVIPGQFLSPFEPARTPLAAWYLDEPVWNGTVGEAKEVVGRLSNIQGRSINGAVTAADGPALEGNPGTGRSGVFNGGGYVEVPYQTGLSPNDFTVSAWVRPTTLTSGDWRGVVVCRQSVSGSLRGYGLYLATDGQLKFFTGGSSWNSLTGTTLAPGQWSHVSATFRTTSVSGAVRTGVRRIFVNGIQVAQDTGTYSVPTDAKWLIGASELNGSAGHFMLGRIDEVRLYSSPMGAEDVGAVMGLRHRLNFAPVVNPPGNLASTVGSVISQPISASDPDGESMTFSAIGLPDGLGISATSGIISGTPNRIGDFAVTVRATDVRGDSGTASFTWSVVANLTVSPNPGPAAPVSSLVQFSASSNGGKNPVFRWDFGDGSPDTDYSASSSASHVYANPGRYLVTVTATDDTGRTVTRSFHQAIHAPLTSRRPRASSSILHDGSNRVWVVNPDHGSVSVVHASNRTRIAEIATGDGPRCIALGPDGNLWVTHVHDSTIAVVDAVSLEVVRTISLPGGSRPFGLVFSPVEAVAYVALEDGGKVLKLDAVIGSVLTSIETGMHVRHLSISADGMRLYGSRFVTPRLPGEETAVVDASSAGGEVLVINPAAGTVERTIVLRHSNAADTAISSRGVPNYLGAAVISPDGLSAWVPSKQDNIKRGVLRDGQVLTHDMTVRAIASRINLVSQTEDTGARVDFDNAGVPSAAVFDPSGSYAFVALEASRMVAVIDVWNRVEIVRFDTGRAPQGLTLSPDGGTLFVQNFMDRTVSVHDVGSILLGVTSAPPAPVVVSTVSSEVLSPEVFAGKQWFYDARDSRVAFQEYISCAACHNDGGHDGRVWDFTGFGEGLRNTITLRGHGGTSQGPLHWSGNFDEVQDFENQIRGFAGGQGLIASGSPHAPMGASNAGRSADLDALAAYVQSLSENGRSPFREPGGGLSASAAAGELVFRSLDCASCHGGDEFTNSALGVFSDIGTRKASSGGRLGGVLSGFDVPTLRGLWSTAPYLHDGSAATLAEAVLAHEGIQISQQDLADLTSYLASIDDAPVRAPESVKRYAGWRDLTPGAGAPDENGDGDLAENLLEFALGGLPGSGATPSGGQVRLGFEGGGVSLVVEHPAGLHGITYQALVSPDLVTWTEVNASTTVVAGGMVVRTFPDLDEVPGLSPDEGFVRLKVTGYGHSAMTLPLGLKAVPLGGSSRTIGIPFRETPVFSSRVTGMNGLEVQVVGNPVVDSGFRGWIEVIEGVHEGHRFDVVSTGAGVITLAAASAIHSGEIPDLTGCRIVLSAHHRMGSVFPKELFKGSTNPSAADQLQFYQNTGTGGQFQLYYLLDARPGNSTHQWRAFLPGGGDQGGRIIAPGEGVLLKRPAGAAPVRLILTGQVRGNDFIQPLRRGVNLLASPFPVAMSPRQRGMLDVASGWRASTNLNSADQFQIYQGGAFRIFYLLDHPTQADQWREAVGGSPNYNDVRILDAAQGLFIKRGEERLTHRVSAPWGP